MKSNKKGAPLEWLFTLNTVLHTHAGNSYQSAKQFQSFLIIPVIPATKRPVNNQPKICCARK